MTSVADGSLWRHACGLAADAPSVLELGTCRQGADSTSCRDTVGRAGQTWVRSDIQDGRDVDRVADIHNLADVFGAASFDMVICRSVFEHVQRPWIAAAEIVAVLRPGGHLYVQTHHTFPLHAYPDDYWRFSTDALRLLFVDAGADVVDAQYLFPAQIVPPDVTPWNPDAPAWLNVDVLARRP